MNTYQEKYLRIWKRAFHEFLGWEEEETVRWAQPLIKLMERSGGVVVNQSPMYYVAREMASYQEYYDDLSQRGRLELIMAVERILHGGKLGPDFPPGYDFSKAKAEIQRIFETAGP